jgi:1-deoxy-D-xylulose-5-phosphate reductoisomerase
MKKKIAILGSTGSIGKTTFNIIKKDKSNFDVELLTTNNNYKEILKQTNQINPKNIIIINKDCYKKIKNRLKKKKINVYNDFSTFYKNFNKKIDYSMCAISGLDGLIPTFELIKYSKIIAIANKESIICAWNLIKKELKKYNTEFIPVDSEHFSIWSILNNSNDKNIEEVIITASGGPFLNLPKNKFKHILPSQAIKHPNWNMGKKISIDSATIMNKVFEIIEAQRLFNIDLKKFKVVIHPKSYVHAIVKFKNGLTKILIHDTDMKYPIFNSIYYNQFKTIKSRKLDFKILNNLDFTPINKKKFPLINIIKNIDNKISLFETVLISANDELVQLFLDKKIKFLDINKYLNLIINIKKFNKLKFVLPKNLDQIIELNKYVRLKTRFICI